MAKTKISEYDSTASNNTDINSINIDEGCSPSGINNAIRALMSHLKNWQGGTSGDTLPVASGGTGSTTASAARTALSAAASGANSDITSLSGLTTAITQLQGGTGIIQKTISNVSRTSNVVTITTSSAHGFTAGHYVTVAATTNTSLNGTFVIASVATNTFTYAQTGSDLSTVADTGNVTDISYCNLVNNVAGTLPTSNGGTGLTSFVAGTNYAAPITATTFTGLQTFSGTSSNLASRFTNTAEVVTVNSGGASGTINYDITTQSILYYTGNASGVLTLNFRASSGTSLNTAMAVGDSVTANLLITNPAATTVTAGSFVVGQTYTIVSVGTTSFTSIGATSNTVGIIFTATGVGSGTGTASYAPYVLTTQVDGTTITPKYQNGAIINTGNASAIDAYTYTIVKTASATFTVFASKTKFA